jgi:hypothetical protein
MGSNIIIHPTRRQEIGFRNRFFGRVMMSVGLTNRQRLKLPTTIFSVRIGNTDDKMEDGVSNL